MSTQRNTATESSGRDPLSALRELAGGPPAASDTTHVSGAPDPLGPLRKLAGESSAPGAGDGGSALAVLARTRPDGTEPAGPTHLQRLAESSPPPSQGAPAAVPGDTLPGTLHLNPAIAPKVTAGSPRPFSPGEWIDNPNGSWSSEITVTVRDPSLNGGRWTVVPSLWLANGHPVKVSEDEAAKLAARSGLAFRSFPSEAAAEKFATQREAAWQTIQPKDAGSVAPLWTGSDPLAALRRLAGGSPSSSESPSLLSRLGHFLFGAEPQPGPFVERQPGAQAETAKGLTVRSPDVAAQAARGLSEAGTGLAEAVPIPAVRQAAQEAQQRSEAFYGQPRTPLGAVAHAGGRLAGEMALSGAGGEAASAAGAGRLVGSLAASVPFALYASASPDQSTLGAAANLTGSKVLKELARNPLARAAVETGLLPASDALLSAASRALAHGAAESAGTAARAAPTAEEMDRLATEAGQQFDGLPDAVKEKLRTIGQGSFERDLARRAGQVEAVRTASEGVGRLGAAPEGLPTLGQTGRLRTGVEAAAESTRPGTKLPSALEAALSRAEQAVGGSEAGAAHLAGIQPAVGAGVGAAVGATQGKTLHDRIRNALLGAAAGALTPLTARMLYRTLRSSPEAMHAIESEDDLLRQFRDLEASVAKGRPAAPGRSAEDFLFTRAAHADLSPEANALLRSEFERATAAVGLEKGTVTWKDVREEAKALGQNPEGFRKALEADRPMTPAEGLAVAQAGARNTEKMVALRSQLERLTGPDGNPLTRGDADAIRKEIADRARVNNVLLGRGAESASRLGAGLSALKMQVSVSLEDPYAMLGLAREVKDAPLSEIEQTKLVQAVNSKDRDEALRILSRLKKSSTDDKIISALKANMLTPATGTVIASSNLTKTAMRELAEEPLAVAFDRLMAPLRAHYTGEELTAARTRFGGRLGAFTKGAREVPKETVRMIRGLPGKMTEAAQALDVPVGDIQAAGQGGENGLTKAEIRAWAGRRTNYLEVGDTFRDKPVRWVIDHEVNGIYNTVAAAHSVFRLPAYEQSIRSQGLALAAREGYTRDTPAFLERARYLWDHPTPAMHVRALRESAEDYFLQPTGVFEHLRSAVAGLKFRHGRILRYATETNVPFSRIMFGLADQATDLTGLGLLRGGWDVKEMIGVLRANRGFEGLKPSDVTKVTAELDRLQHEAGGHIARGLVGLPLMGGLGFWLARRGRIATHYPEDKRQQQLWQAEGKRENSILLGGKWRSLDMFGPYGLAVAIGATVHNLASQDDPAPVYKKALASLGAIAQSIGDMTIGQGLQQIGQLAEGQPGATARMAETPVRALVPNLLQHIARAVDPTKRIAEGYGEDLQRAVPGLASRLPAKRSALGGQKLKGPGGWWANQFSPSRGAVPDLRQGNPVLAEADRLKTFPLPPKKPKGLDNATWRQIRSHVEQSYGERMLTTAKQVMGSWAYANANDEEKKHMLESAWTKAKDRLKRQMVYELVQAGKLSPRP